MYRYQILRTLKNRNGHRPLKNPASVELRCVLRYDTDKTSVRFAGSRQILHRVPVGQKRQLLVIIMIIRLR